MQTAVVALAPDTSAREAERILAEHRIGGAPVVDEAGRVLGVVSQSDLVRLDAARPSNAAAGAFFSDVDDYRDLAALPADESVVPVSSVMSREVLSVAPDATLQQAAHLMREHRVHRLLVVENGVLRGVVTALDLLIAVDQPLADPPATSPPGSTRASR
jgi:CBS domain-containing protein